MTTTQTMRRWWADYRCGNGASKPVRLFGRNAGTCAAPAYDGFKAFEKAMEANGYTGVQSVWIPRNCPTGIGGKTCQSDGTNCSIHNYRVAVDVDPYKYGNPHFQKRFGNGWNFADCKLTRLQVEAVEAIRNTHGEQYFRWLGWLIGDTMHFELQVPPERTEVDWSTVPGEEVQPPDEQGDDMLPLEEGDNKEDVRLLQDKLNLTYGAGLTLDAKYGTSTVAAVKTYLGSATGHPDGKEGRWCGAKQWNVMDKAFVDKYGGGAKGDKGDPGADGADGTSGTLTITGDVTLP